MSLPVTPSRGVTPVRFCPNCGAPRPGTGVRHCGNCGASFDMGGSIPVFEPARQRSPLVVAILAFLSGGVYSWFWLWRSWLELKRIRGDSSMHPFWHAVAVAIPLYGWFRFEAHARALDTLLEQGASPVRAGSRLLTLVFTLLTLVTYTAIALQVGGMETGPPYFLVSALAYSYITLTGQEALNAVYRGTPGAPVPLRTHVLEILFVGVFSIWFVLFWSVRI